MRLSTVFELLLIFILIAFAASRHIGKKGSGATRQGLVSRYCKCNDLACNCCRDFSLPVVSIKGPGCASISYQNGDSMRLTMTFGNRVLRNITLSGRKPRPVCMSLPGGVSKFCGRVYGIERDGDNQFKACLALELRALEDIEAALRVSCFKFGPQGIKLVPGSPVPPSTSDEDDDDDYDDEDDDDDFGLDDDDDEASAENDVESPDYEGLSFLSDDFLDGFFGGASGGQKPVNKPTLAAVNNIPKRKPQRVKPTNAPLKVIASPSKPTVVQSDLVTTNTLKEKLSVTKVSPTTEESTTPVPKTTVSSNPVTTPPYTNPTTSVSTTAAPSTTKASTLAPRTTATVTMVAPTVSSPPKSVLIETSPSKPVPTSTEPEPTSTPPSETIPALATAPQVEEMTNSASVMAANIMDISNTSDVSEGTANVADALATAAVADDTPSDENTVTSEIVASTDAFGTSGNLPDADFTTESSPEIEVTEIPAPQEEYSKESDENPSQEDVEGSTSEEESRGTEYDESAPWERFPGLYELVRHSRPDRPWTPAARSARTHRRMRI